MNNGLIMFGGKNMSKPSMFSKDYKKEIKKRRTRRILLIIVPIIGLTIFLMTDFNALINSGKSMKKGIIWHPIK